MKNYTDVEFYKNHYLFGRTPKISDADFPYWVMLASGEIRQRTFGRIDSLAEVPEEAGMCCCELAEKLNTVESMKHENWMILLSYGTDGETGTYKTTGQSQSTTASGQRIIRTVQRISGRRRC